MTTGQITVSKSLPVEPENDFLPTKNRCYVCGESNLFLLDEGPAVGKMCEKCAQGFIVP